MYEKQARIGYSSFVAISALPTNDEASVGRDRTMLLIISITAIVSLGMNIMLIPKYGMLGASTVNAFSELLILAGCFYFQYRHCHPSQQNHSNN